MPQIPRIVLAPVEYVPTLSLHFVLRCALCLVLTAFNAGVIVFAARPLYQATANHPIEFFGMSLLFAALLGSLVRVWSVALRFRNR